MSTASCAACCAAKPRSSLTWLRFQLADYVEVQGATLENGLLHLELKRELPESKKPRTIQINGSTPTIEDKSVN